MTLKGGLHDDFGVTQHVCTKEKCFNFNLGQWKSH